MKCVVVLAFAASRTRHYSSLFAAQRGSLSPTLPDALIDVSAKLEKATSKKVLNENAIFYFEEILTRLIYGGDSRVRVEVRCAGTLKILDALVNAGSSAAYKLRDDFLTPIGT